MHSGLKNPTEALTTAILEYERRAEQLREAEAAGGTDADLAALRALTDRQALQVMSNGRFVATRVSQYVEVTRAASAHLDRGTRQVTYAVLRLFSAETVERHAQAVVEELDPDLVSALDNNLLASCLSELVTNAVAAEASEIVVRSRLVEDTVEVSVLCRCGADLAPGRPGAGTLGLLADRLERYGGTLLVEHLAPGAHVTTARWPADGRD